MQPASKPSGHRGPNFQAPIALAVGILLCLLLRQMTLVINHLTHEESHLCSSRERILLTALTLLSNPACDVPSSYFAGSFARSFAGVLLQDFNDLATASKYMKNLFTSNSLWFLRSRHLWLSQKR